MAITQLGKRPKGPQMDRYLNRQQFIRLNHWVVQLRDKRIPQLFVMTSGGLGVLCSWLFLNLPERFREARNMQFLINAIPPLSWGIIFGAVGVVLLTCAWIDYTKAVLPSALFAVALFTFAGLSAVSVFYGPATGLVMILSFFFGIVNLLTSILSVAPINEAIIRRGPEVQP